MASVIAGYLASAQWVAAGLTLLVSLVALYGYEWWRAGRATITTSARVSTPAARDALQRLDELSAPWLPGTTREAFLSLHRGATQPAFTLDAVALLVCRGNLLGEILRAETFAKALREIGLVVVSDSRLPLTLAEELHLKLHQRYRLSFVEPLARQLAEEIQREKVGEGPK